MAKRKAKTNLQKLAASTATKGLGSEPHTLSGELRPSTPPDPTDLLGRDFALHQLTTMSELVKAGPTAVSTLVSVMNDPEARDRVKAASDVLGLLGFTAERSAKNAALTPEDIGKITGTAAATMVENMAKSFRVKLTPEAMRAVTENKGESSDITIPQEVLDAVDTEEAE